MAKRGRGGGTDEQSPKHRNQKPRTGATVGGTGSLSYWKIGVSLSISACLIAAAYHHFFNGESNDSLKMSVILRNHVNPVLQSIDQKYQVDAYLLYDPLAEVLKTKLRPVQERIASLKTQCAQYEKMEQIPGGPTQFIQSSLHEIQTDILQRVLELDAECNAILQQYMDGGLALAKSSNTMTAASALRLNDDAIKIMIMEGVFFIPVSDPRVPDSVPMEVLQEARKVVNLEQVAAKVEELAVLYEQLEEAQMEAETAGQESGFNSLDSLREELDNMPDEVYDRLEPYLLKMSEKRKTITDFKRNSSKYMQLFHELHGAQLKELNGATAKILDNNMRRRRPYLDLYHGIQKEIANLRIRIENLKYSYAKRKGVD